MDSNIATASANLARIKRREFSYLGYRAIQKFLVSGTFPTAADSVSFIPTIESEESLGDILNRTSWYCPPSVRKRVCIDVPVANHLLDISLDDVPVPDAQEHYVDDTLSVRLHRRDTNTNADLFLVHDKHSRTSSVALRNLSRVRIVDPMYYSFIEANAWKEVSESIRQDEDNASTATFAELEAETEAHDDAYVFATGPSLDEAVEYDISDDALKIVCNSIVKNEGLVAHIDPDVLVFADPVFHFGPSRYAAQFRRDAARVLRNHDCLAVIPRQHRGLFVERFPDIADQVVGVRRIESDDFIYPNSSRLEVVGTGNIMTVFMLPIASALTENIYIIGADGRRESESYFWEHSDTAQYDDKLMNTVAETHPSFFRDRIYTDYYEEHVETLTEMIEDGEKRGQEYHSLTSSHVPCLQQRYTDPADIGILSRD